MGFHTNCRCVQCFTLRYMQLKWYGVPDHDAALVAYQEFGVMLAA